MLDHFSNIPDLTDELQFSFSRSSGPGGQNVNKVNSKVELRFDIANSALLNAEQKQILTTKLGSKINSEGILIITSQRSRSQLANKEDVAERFRQLIIKALTPTKPRRKTNPSRASIEKRLEYKRLKSEIKQTRKKIDD